MQLNVVEEDLDKISLREWRKIMKNREIRWYKLLNKNKCPKNKFNKK